MDWYVDARDGEAVRALRHEFTAYLERHAAAGSDVKAAEVVFAELVANAGQHGSGSAWISLDWSAEAPALTVHDLGPGFTPRIALPDDPFAAGGRGLYMSAHLATELEVASKRAGGARVSVTLPVRREQETSIDPRRRSVATLPASTEADSDGLFGKESFLRALIVQLAQNLELDHGPDLASAVIAQVGADVGSRMEESYREAKEIADTLTPTQMADLYVQLKHAIDGDFYIIEATEERIVLGNRRCPFGDVVRQAPSLCRMTSSVFGGIAANNMGNASVQLEERIAVGDPECRVTVWLKPRSDSSFAHNYTSKTP